MVNQKVTYLKETAALKAQLEDYQAMHVKKEGRVNEWRTEQRIVLKKLFKENSGALLQTENWLSQLC